MSAGLTAEQMSKLEAELHALHGQLTAELAAQQEGEAAHNAAEIRLRLVTAALTALKLDEYGHCEECEEPIGYERLEAKPEARYCEACQHAREQRR